MTRLDLELKKVDNANVVIAALIGKSAQTVQNYRDAKYQPPLDVAMKIAEFIGVPVESLMEEVDTEGNHVTITA